MVTCQMVAGSQVIESLGEFGMMLPHLLASAIDHFGGEPNRLLIMSLLQSLDDQLVQAGDLRFTVCCHGVTAFGADRRRLKEKCNDAAPIGTGAGERVLPRSQVG